MAYVGFERRSNRRADVPATAVLLRGGAAGGRFDVANLSAAGALLIGASELGRGDHALLRLEAPGCEPVVVHARIVRGGDGDGVNALAVEFRHRSPDTEDAIQDVVLSALEEDARSSRSVLAEQAEA
ncbi:MAG: PilZ domain-containing protein [Myxococcales bacterium]|nr:PilZ domain-containing protein [Myxococcales bacterium]